MNDIDIADDELLMRRIDPEFVDEYGFTTQNFTNHEMSVDRCSMRTKEQCLEGYENHGLVVFSAKDARELGFEVYSDQRTYNLGHAIVKGTKTGAKKKKLKEKCKVICLPNVDENKDTKEVTS